MPIFALFFGTKYALVSQIITNRLGIILDDFLVHIAHIDGFIVTFSGIYESKGPAWPQYVNLITVI